MPRRTVDINRGSLTPSRRSSIPKANAYPPTFKGGTNLCLLFARTVKFGSAPLWQPRRDAGSRPEFRSFISTTSCQGRLGLEIRTDSSRLPVGTYLYYIRMRIRKRKAFMSALFPDQTPQRFPHACPRPEPAGATARVSPETASSARHPSSAVTYRISCRVAV